MPMSTSESCLLAVPRDNWGFELGLMESVGAEKKLSQTVSGKCVSCSICLACYMMRLMFELKVCLEKKRHLKRCALNGLQDE